LQVTGIVLVVASVTGCTLVVPAAHLTLVHHT